MDLPKLSDWEDKLVKNFLERIEKDPVPDVRLDALEALGQTTKPGVPEVSRVTLCVFKSPMVAAPSTDDNPPMQGPNPRPQPSKRAEEEALWRCTRVAGVHKHAQRCASGRLLQACTNLRSRVTVDA